MEASNDIMIRISPNEGKNHRGRGRARCLLPEKHHRGRSASVLQRQPADSRRGLSQRFPAAEYYLALSKRDGKTLRSLAPQAVRRCFGLRYALSPLPDPSSGIWLFAQQEGKASHCRIGVVADEIPTPETPMYYYPFSNVSRESGSLCVGANTLPIYKKPHKAHNLPAFLLSIPNNMHYYAAPTTS